MALAAGTGAKQWEGTADGDVVALAVDGSTVYAGGHFDIITGSNIIGQNLRDNLAAFDAATGSLKAWAPPGRRVARRVGPVGLGRIRGRRRRLPGGGRDRRRRASPGSRTGSLARAQ